MKKLTVDRIEENIAVCLDENEALTPVCVSNIPFKVYEGAVITVNEDGSYVHDIECEEKRREELFALQESLFDE